MPDPESALLARAMAEPAADVLAERIMDAALAQFGEFGLQRSTVEDVARRAGTARVTVYRRFASKDALIEAVLLRECRRCLAALDAAVADLAAIEDRIVEGFRVAFGIARAHPLVGGLLRVEPQVILPFLTVDAGPAFAAVREYLAGHLRRAREEGEPAGGGDVVPVAELMVRVTVSFLVSPDSAIPMRTDDDLRAFARRYLVPMLGAR